MAIVINDDIQSKVSEALLLGAEGIDMPLIEEFDMPAMVMSMVEWRNGPPDPTESRRTITSQVTAVKTNTGLRTF
jgi:hypothetical protein